MTNREFYEKVITANIDTEVTQHASVAIKRLDDSNMRRVEKQAEKTAENRSFIDELMGYLTSEAQTASDLKEKFDASTQKISYLMRKAVELGLCEVTDVKVAKKGVQKGYFIPSNE